MSQIVIGKSGHRNVAIDLKLLLETRMLITADSGGGKTWALKRLVEQAFGHVGILIIDPEGEFAPMRQNLDFYMVGKGGDTPADPRSAAKVAIALMGARASAICDIYELKPLERHAFVKAFIEALMEAPKGLRRPYLVIVDEAHMFCPEKGMGESIAAESIRDLFSRGRKRLLCGIVATQRVANLAKSVTTQCGNRMVGPVFDPLNQVRCADELGIPKEKATRQKFFDLIKMAEPGTFHVLGRAIARELTLVHVGPIDTPHGEEALKYELAPPPPTEKVRELLAKLGDLPKQAEEEARTIADFKKQIKDLKQELRSRPVEVRTVEKAIPKTDGRLKQLLEDAMRIMVQISAIGFDSPEIKPEELEKVIGAVKAEVRRIAGEKLSARDRELNQLRREAASLAKRAKDLLEKISGEKISIDVETHRFSGGEIHPQKEGTHTSESRRVTAIPRIAPNPRPDNSSSDTSLPVGEKAILTALIQYPDGCDRRQLSILTGYKRSSRDAYIARLRSKGYADEQGDLLIATDQGVSVMGNVTPLPTGQELQEYWLRELPIGESKIFGILLEAGGEPIDRAAFDELCGFARSSRDAYLSRLVAKQIVETVGRGQVKAAKLLFE